MRLAARGRRGRGQRVEGDDEFAVSLKDVVVGGGDVEGRGRRRSARTREGDGNGRGVRVVGVRQRRRDAGGGAGGSIDKAESKTDRLRSRARNTGVGESDNGGAALFNGDGRRGRGDFARVVVINRQNRLVGARVVASEAVRAARGAVHNAQPYGLVRLGGAVVDNGDRDILRESRRLRGEGHRLGGDREVVAAALGRRA